MRQGTFSCWFLDSWNAEGKCFIELGSVSLCLLLQNSPSAFVYLRAWIRTAVSHRHLEELSPCSEMGRVCHSLLSHLPVHWIWHKVLSPS